MCSVTENFMGRSAYSIFQIMALIMLKQMFRCYI